MAYSVSPLLHPRLCEQDRVRGGGHSSRITYRVRPAYVPRQSRGDEEAACWMDRKFFSRCVDQGFQQGRGYVCDAVNTAGDYRWGSDTFYTPAMCTCGQGGPVRTKRPLEVQPQGFLRGTKGDGKNHTRCLFRKFGASRTSCPRTQASSPRSARPLDSHFRGNDARLQELAVYLRNGHLVQGKCQEISVIPTDGSSLQCHDR
jgi:hypothetical protein